MVVAITGVLASVAIPAFSGYVQKTRTSEATNFLGVIKLREEAYRSEFGQYAGSSAVLGDIDFTPGDASVMKDAKQRGWPSPAVPFDTLGARPDGEVRFGYGVAAGTPAVAVANLAATHGMTAARADFYFVAQAVTDLNGDGDELIFEVTSFTRNVWVSNPERGWD
jgi:type II secretory pathway pseudopilin PulG